MEIKTIKKVYFSPAGTTKIVIDSIANNFNLTSTEIDLLRNPLEQEITIEEGELLIVALPVYFGRIPEISRKMLINLKGENALAIAVVVYGNREYDDALLELRDILIKNGFSVIGAGAFVAQHSLFPIIAKDRPDAKDIEIAIGFSKKCQDIIGSLSSKPQKIISVKGNEKYCKGGAVSIPPTVSDSCTKCEICDAICPVGAINTKSPQDTKEGICISCAACIANCPEKARSFSGEAYKLKEKMLSEMCSKYKTPETFYI